MNLDELEYWKNLCQAVVVVGVGALLLVIGLAGLSGVFVDADTKPRWSVVKEACIAKGGVWVVGEDLAGPRGKNYLPLCIKKEALHDDK